MNIDFKNTTFKDSEDPAGYDAFEHAAYFNEFLDYLIAGLRPAQLQALKLSPSTPQVAYSEN